MPTAPIVLVIDTSSPAVTAALVQVQGADIRVLAGRAPSGARAHGELLTSAVRDVLAESGRALRDVAAVVAGTGPGPFTGLRVGLVTAAAIADALGVPAYGVCSLDGIGLAAAEEAALLVATDARRREVYWARYAHGVRVEGPSVARPADVPVADADAVAGAGAALHDEAWPQLRRRPELYPDPAALVRAAADRVLGGAPVEVLTPRYLRRPDAKEPGAPKAVTR